jgi:hypothetical protein
MISLILIFNRFLGKNSENHKILEKTSKITIYSNSTHISTRNKTSYKILLWTKYTNNWTYFDLKELKCQYSNCILTENRTDLNISDAVLINWRLINYTDVPKYHLTHQKWVLCMWESPPHSPIRALDPFGDNINWTMTYRQDSDVFVPYGKIIKCDQNFKVKHKFEGKKKSIAWVVSNCKTIGKREVYVKELKKYIDVDIYGKCGDFECSKNNKSLCYEMIAKNYKFYLSFENSVSFQFKKKNFIYLFFNSSAKIM